MTIDDGYSRYIVTCDYENSVALNKHNHLLEYKKNKHGHRIGAVLAYRAVDGQVYIGVSLYNKKKEKRPFSKEVAINKTLHGAYPFSEFTVNAKDTAAWDAIPASMVDDVKRMLSRAVRYFR